MDSSLPLIDALDPPLNTLWTIDHKKHLSDDTDDTQVTANRHIHTGPACTTLHLLSVQLNYLQSTDFSYFTFARQFGRCQRGWSHVAK